MTSLRHLGLILALAPPLLRADSYPRQPDLQPVHYVFGIQLRDGTDELQGQTEVTLRVLRAGLREARLDLASARDGKGMTVTAVNSGGAPVAFSHAGDLLRLPLPEGLPAGRELTFQVAYRGVPGGGLRVLANKHGARTFFSENWPDHAHDWLPVVDHVAAKATGEFIVTAPAGYQVVANGLLVDQTDLPGGLRRTHWAQGVAIPVWLYTLGVAPFAVHQAGLVGSVPLQTWVFPQEEAVRPALEAIARKALTFLSERVAPYPFEKLANVEAAGIHGGMESATAIFYGEEDLADRPLQDLVVHEIAHQWFGDSVTENDWNDLWLSEGFATYLTLLFKEQQDGPDAFLRDLEGTRARVLLAERRHPDTPVIHAGAWSMDQLLTAQVYGKAAWVLHMLRRQVGTGTFWQGLRAYYLKFQGGTASTADFRAVMEQASGQDLGWFFSQWLTRAGVPRIEGTWRWDAGARQVVVDLAQTQAGEPYRLTLDLGLGGTVRTLPFAGSTLHAALPADQEPAALTLDPGLWLLLDGRIEKR